MPGQPEHIVRSAVASVSREDWLELTQQVQWAGDLIAAVTQAELDRTWNPEDVWSFAQLKRPSQASEAWKRHFGVPETEDHLDSRAMRMALARAGEIVRAQAHQIEIVQALLAGKYTPCTPVEYRNADRRLRAFIQEHGRLPVDFFELAPTAPQVKPVVATGATDKQFTEWLDVTSTHATLRIKLPTRPHPRSARDWSWMEVRVGLASSTQAHMAAGAVLNKPTLVVEDGRLRINVPCTRPAPAISDDPVTRALAADWGERRLLTATAVRLGEDGDPRVSGRPLFFDSKAAQAIIRRRRRQYGKLQRLRDLKLALLQGREDPLLRDQVAQHELEMLRIKRKNRAVTRQLAQAAARWIVEQARASGVQTIAIEDLKSLEARFRSKGLNSRINSQIRSQVFDLTRSAAAEHGITVTAVPPRGTSALCPRCLHEHAHVKSPSDPRQGRGWASCSHCGHSADRDHAAAERIGALAVAPEHERVRRQRTPTLTTRTARPRPRRPAPAVPSSPAASAAPSASPVVPSVAHDRSACPASHASSVRRGVTPGDPQGVAHQVTGPRSVPGRSTTSSLPTARDHRALEGMRQGLTGLARFTITARPTPPRRLRKLKND